MALIRESSTTFRLLDTVSGLYYPVTIAATIDDQVGTSVDGGSPSGGGNDYVTMLSDDGLKYRWTLESYVQEGETFIENVFTLAADQNEEALGSFSLQYGVNWWAIYMQSLDVEGETLQQLAFGPGLPFGQSGAGGGPSGVGAGRLGVYRAPCDWRDKDCPYERYVDFGTQVPAYGYVNLTGPLPPTGFVKV